MLSHDILEANTQIQSEQQALGLILSAGILEAQRSFTEQMEALETDEEQAEDIEEELEVIKVRCCILLEEVPVTECLRCPAGHSIHSSMVAPFINTEFEKDFDTLKANCGQVKCPFENCEEHFLQDDLETIVSPEVFRKVLKMKQRFDEYSEYVEGLEAGQEQMEESIRQQFMKPDGSFCGFACPRCGYGPIDKKACDDLSAHQGQRISLGVHISNKCPQCFYFNHNIANWKKWDGTFLGAQKIADIRDLKEQAGKKIRLSMQEEKEKLSKLTIKKKEFMAKNGFHARTLLMAQIRGGYVPTQVEDDDEEESEDIDVIDANEADNVEDPTILMQAMSEATGEQKRLLSIEMMKNLRRAKNDVLFRKFEKLIRRQKKAGSNFNKFRQDYEVAISTALAEYTKN